MSYFDKEQYTKENFVEKLIADGLHMLSEYEGQEGILRVINEFIVTAARNEKYQKRLFEIQEEFLNGFRSIEERRETGRCVTTCNRRKRSYASARN